MVLRILWLVLLLPGIAGAASSPPTVTGVSPNSGTPLGGAPVTINGSGFITGATVTFDGIFATGIAVVSTSQIACTTPAHAAGAVNVSVINPDTQNGTLANGFTYGGPVSLSGIVPVHGTTNGGTPITINGANFATGATVTLGGTAATSVIFVSTTQLTCVTPAHVGGATVDVVVTDSGTNSSTLSAAYTYDLAPAPTLESVTPNSGSTNGGTVVNLDGSNFANGATITFAGRSASNVIFASAGQLTCTTPPNPAGAVFANVTVTNPDTQSFTLSGAFSYIVVLAPSVSAVVPKKGTTNGGTVVRVNGAHFVPGATVQFGNSQATGVTFVASTRLTCVTPPSTTGGGLVKVIVTNPDGSVGNLTNAFNYKLVHKPTIASVTPFSGPAAGGTNITINGGHYTSGTTITIGGVAVSNLKIVTTKQITCTTPAGIGVAAVTVSNPDGQNSTRLHGFIFEGTTLPVVTSSTPNSGVSTGGYLVTISGANFETGATVTFGGIAATQVNIVNSTLLTCIAPAVSPGTVNIVVSNPDGQLGTLSSGFTFTTVP